MSLSDRRFTDVKCLISLYIPKCLPYTARPQYLDLLKLVAPAEAKVEPKVTG